MGKSIAIPKELIESPIWDNGKPYSEGQAYIQFIIWAESMGDDTHFINGNMVTLKHNEFIMSQRKMAESMNWTQSAVNRYLKKLVTLNQCCINNESKMTRVTVNIVEVPQKSESILNQDVNQPTDLFDLSFGGSTNSTLSTNSNNNINNIYNNTNNTTTNNNISKKPSKNSAVGVGRGKAKPYTTKPKDLQMVIEYFEEKYPEDIQRATHFYEYFESVGWLTGKAKLPIKNWKMAVANWMRSQKRFDREKEPQKSQGDWVEKFRIATTGEFIVYCTNKKCNHYNDTLFAKDKWAIKKGCNCSHPFTHSRAKSKETYANTKTHTRRNEGKTKTGENEELISWQEFKESQKHTQGSKESTTRSRTPEGDSQHISRLLDSLFQQR